MAVEGFSLPPPDEVKVGPPPTPEMPGFNQLMRRRGIKGILDSLRFGGQNKESKEDDEDEEKKKRAGRIGRFLRRIIGVEEDGDTPKEHRDRGSIFFGIGEIPETPEIHEIPEIPESEQPLASDVVESTPIEAVAGESWTIPHTEPAETVTETIESEVVILEDEPEETVPEETELIVEPPAETVTAPLTVEAIPQDTPRQTDAFYTNRRGVRPEATPVYDGYEHHRVTKLKERGESLEREVKKHDKKIEENARTNKAPTPEAAPRPLERLVPKLHPEKSPEVTPKSPERRTISTETTKEQKREAVERAVERHTREISTEKKQEIIEKILIAPEFKGALDTEIHKDIVYELSHEAKDMDSQSQSVWAALQAAADKTAKANAKALAEAENRISTAETGDALRMADIVHEPQQKELYKKAALSGFVTAIVLAAVYFVIMLMNKR